MKNVTTAGLIYSKQELVKVLNEAYNYCVNKGWMLEELYKQMMNGTCDFSYNQFPIMYSCLSENVISQIDMKILCAC